MKLQTQTLLSLFLFCFFSVSIFAQSNDNIFYTSYTISLKHIQSKEIKHLQLRGEEASQFDAAKYISTHIGTYDIQIFGTSFSESGKTNFRFNSKDLPDGLACHRFCEKLIEITKMPLLGVSVDEVEDFSGAYVVRVVEGSAAEQAGILSGDIITYIEDIQIHSACDLKIAISNFAAGDEVEVSYLHQGQERKTYATLAYALSKKVTWAPCCDAVVENLPTHEVPKGYKNLQVFPNPTEDVSYLRFSSDNKGALQIIVSNINGQKVMELYMEDFDGYCERYIDLSGYAAGVYTVSIIQGEHLFTERLVLQKR